MGPPARFLLPETLAVRRGNWAFPDESGWTRGWSATPGEDSCSGKAWMTSHHGSGSLQGQSGGQVLGR